MSRLHRYLPALVPGSDYSSKTLVNDLIEAGVVTLKQIPESPMLVF